MATLNEELRFRRWMSFQLRVQRQTRKSYVLAPERGQEKAARLRGAVRQCLAACL